MATTGGDGTGHAERPARVSSIPASAEDLPTPARRTTVGDVMGMVAGGLMIITTATVILGTIGYMIYSML